MNKMKVLLTAFEPFDERSVNSSMILLENLELEGVLLTKVILPVTYDTEKLEALMSEYQAYDLILHLGEAANRKKVSLEAIAINKQGATIQDNLGVMKQDEEIIEGAPLAYETTIPLKKIVTRVSNPHLDISYHAGTYICNLTYYHSLHYLNSHHLNQLCLFIHYPLFGENTLFLEEALSITKSVMNEIKKTY